MKRILALAIIGLSASSCQGGARDGSLEKAEAIRIADEHIARRMPGDRRSKYRVEATDLGNSWQVNYLPPEGSLGGYSVQVDEASRQVTNFVIQQ